jgi:cytochrome P450
MVAIYQVRRDRAIEDRAEAATRQFVAWMRTQVIERRTAPADDVLSQLITARDATGDALTDDEIITTAILLLNAGHEATVHAIGNGVAALLGARADGVRVFLDAPVTTAEEMLRFDAPLHLFTRYALEDVTVAGRRFALGEQIALLLGSANRDDACFVNADRFDAHRHPNPHVAFGAGRHACLGAPLARLELRTAVRVLFERLPSLQPAGPPTVAETWHFRGHTAVPIVWTPPVI